MSLYSSITEHVKFFPKDVISGNADKPGDVFTAYFLTGEMKFRVNAEDFSPECFYAAAID